MTIETEIVTRLEDDAGVGAVAGNRIYPDKLPQSPTYPALVYTVIDDIPSYDMAGELDRSFARIQIDSWAVTKTSVVSLAAAVKSSLSAFNSTLTALNATIKLEIQRSEYDDDVTEYRIIQDYTITYR